MGDTKTPLRRAFVIRTQPPDTPEMAVVGGSLSCIRTNWTKTPFGKCRIIRNRVGMGIWPCWCNMQHVQPKGVCSGGQPPPPPPDQTNRRYRGVHVPGGMKKALKKGAFGHLVAASRQSNTLQTQAASRHLQLVTRQTGPKGGLAGDAIYPLDGDSAWPISRTAHPKRRSWLIQGMDIDAPPSKGIRDQTGCEGSLPNSPSSSTFVLQLPQGFHGEVTF